MSGFHDYTDGSRRVTIRVEHHMSTWDLASAWVWKHYRYRHSCPNPESKRDVLRVAREAMQDNPQAVYYVSDDVPVSEIERFERVVSDLFEEE